MMESGEKAEMLKKTEGLSKNHLLTVFLVHREDSKWKLSKKVRAELIFIG